MNNKLNIIYILRDDGGCGFYRCVQPATFLNRSGLAQAEIFMHMAPKEKLLLADLVIIQNTGPVEGSNMANFMIENRIPFMTEFDDHIHHISPHNLAGYSAWNPSTLFLHRAMEVTRKAVGVTVSTEQLARELFPYNSMIYVIPNYLDKDKWENPIIKKQDNKIRIGWCGGNAHADDLFMVSKVLEKIVKEYKGRVLFETMGMTRQELAGVFSMKIFNEICPSCNYEGELHHYPGESLDNYPLILASKGWDIAIAPVINNAFGNGKSDIKIKEYAATGLPVVASPVQPYTNAAKNNAQILFADTFDEWYNHLKDLIENPNKRDQIVRQNKEWVANYWIQDNIEKIFNVYKQTILRATPILGTKSDRLKLVNKII